MTENKQTTQQPSSTVKTTQRRPNDVGAVSVQGHIRISDPQTKQVFVEKRA
jgi:hypothetical protein